MIKASAHIWLVVCYGTLAAVCGLASIGSISAGIGWMPMLIGGVVFTGGGVLHLGIMLVRREKQYVRQMLILSQAVQDLQKTSDDPVVGYEAPVRAAGPQHRPEPPRPDSLRPETPRAPVRDDPGFDEDATLNFAEPDYELEEETRLRQMRAHAGGKRRPGTRKKPAALDELLDDDEPRRAPPLTRQPSRDFEDEDSGEDDFDEYDFEEEKIKDRFDQENKFDGDKFDQDDFEDQDAFLEDPEPEEDNPLHAYVTRDQTDPDDLEPDDMADEEEEADNEGEIRTLKNLVSQLSAREEMPRPARRPEGMTRKIPTPPRLARELSPEQLLDNVREALREERVAIYLQPVVDLNSRKPRYQECYTRLIDAHGQEIGPERFLGVAEQAGLMPTIDQLLLFHGLRQLKRQTSSKVEGFFFNLASPTFSDPTFFRQFLEQMEANPELTPRLILEIGEPALVAGGPDLLSALRQLRGVGFRLSLDQIVNFSQATDLVDQMGFHFVKMRAPMLLVALDQDDGKKTLQKWHEKGCTLVAERIETEAGLREVQEHDVRLGQGFLFGPPSKVR